MTPDELTIAAPELGVAALFWSAHWVVKAVMLLLVVASVISWAVIIGKARVFMTLQRDSDTFRTIYGSQKTLADMGRSVRNHALQCPVAEIFLETLALLDRRQRGQLPSNQLFERLDAVHELIVHRARGPLAAHLPILATVASAAPFVGLFGTVWGIMNSFQAIALSKQTSLAVVAPGIAEALFATALGLAAAIPAAVGYNILTGRLADIESQAEDFSQEFRLFLRSLGSGTSAAPQAADRPQDG